MTIEDRKLEYIAVGELKPAERNARTHSKRQRQQVAASIERHGFTNPVLVDDEDSIIAGHLRVEAAKILNLKRVPCLRLSGMSPEDKHAYMLADNKLALNAGWDTEILADELGTLLDLGFDLSLTGFEHYEVDAILTVAAESACEGSEAEDEQLEPASTGKVVCTRGDLWSLGRHHLLCGDAKDADDMDRLMDGGRADMVFTDPPYNQRIAGNVSGLGRTRHREFPEASGELSRAEFAAFLKSSFEQMERVSKSGAIVYTCMDWRHLGEILEAGHAAFTEMKNMCVWAKTNAGMGTFYRSQHELVLVWKVGDAPHVNNFGLGDKGRHRTNVWTYAGVNTFKTERMDELSAHPTVKPVALVADAIRDASNRNGIVLDSFGGSGTTLIACEKTGRRARLLELDPAYCDVILRRWQAMTGKAAIRAADGVAFENAEMKAGRTASAKGKAR